MILKWIFDRMAEGQVSDIKAALQRNDGNTEPRIYGVAELRID